MFLNRQRRVLLSFVVSFIVVLFAASFRGARAQDADAIVDDSQDSDDSADGDVAEEADAPTLQLPFAKGESYYLLQGFNSAFSRNGGMAYSLDFTWLS